MKKMRRFAGLVLAMVMVMSMAVSVFADATAEHTITIKYDKNTHTYAAYQVFAGDLAADKETLSNIQWGNGVNGAALLNALAVEGTPYADCETAADVAEVLVGFADDSEQLDVFARVVANHLVANNTTETPIYYSEVSTGKDSNDKYTYTIDVVGDGYYFVKENNTVAANADAHTKYILKVVGDVELNAKADAPSITKKIVEGANRVDANNGSVGDVVTYELKSKVPAMDGYNKYFFIMHDSLSDGLTLNEEAGFTVTVGNKTLNTNEYDVVIPGSETGCTFEIIFKNFIQYNTDEFVGKDVIVTYSATIDEDAVIGNKGNPNTVYLEYSNNPNVDYEGTPENGDKPGEDDVTGVTPEDTVITYVTGIKVYKVDENGNKLTGAEFELTGTKVNKVKVIKKEFSEVTQGGTHYKLKDGTYTEQAPTPETAEKYASEEKKYAIVETETWIEKTEQVSVKAFVGEDGYVRFEGLGEGVYELEETTTPDGYNSLNGKITVTITCTEPETVVTKEDEATWKYVFSFDGDDVEANEVELNWITIKNHKGTVLPETGGMGTTLFYVIGATLAIGAAVVMVTRKRMSAN